MKSSDEIFQLVKSLTKQEKSYFKKIASAFKDDEESNYIKMFDEIVNQASKSDEYDENKIKKGDYSGKFLKNLSYHKNYLYNMILSTLVNYHKENMDLIYLRNLISQAEILINKLLFEPANKVIGRASKFAEERELYSFQHEINYLDRSLKRQILSSDENSLLSSEFQKKQNEILIKIKNIDEYFYLHDSYSNLMKKNSTGKNRSEDEHSELEVFFNNDLFKNENNALTFQSKTMMNNVLLQNSINKVDYENAYKYAAANNDLWEQNFHKTLGNLERYIYSLNNLLTCQIRLNLFEESTETVRKMKELQIKYPKNLTEQNKVFIYYSTAVLQISQHIQMLDAAALRKVLKESETELSLYENKIKLYQRITLYYYFGLSNFILAEYEKCIHWMSKIINIGKTDLSMDYQCYSRIIFLICYYELGYIDSLEYALKSAYHFLSTREKVYKYENIILQYLRRSFRIKTKKELNDMFLEMKNDLEKIVNEPFEKNAFDAFNILIWLDSKIRNVSVMEVLKDARRET